MKLFLDDIREPKQCLPYMNLRIVDSEIYREEWTVVRNYDEFRSAINDHAGKITCVSFDHDLAEEHYSPKMYKSMEEYYADIEGKGKTGLDCAKYFRWFYNEHRLPLPRIIVHSMNPVGTKAITDLFNLKP